MFSVGPDDDIDRVAELMREHAVRRIPVVADEQPVGIVTLGDLAVERAPETPLGNISASRPNR